MNQALSYQMLEPLFVKVFQKGEIIMSSISSQVPEFRQTLQKYSKARNETSLAKKVLGIKVLNKEQDPVQNQAAAEEVSGKIIKFLEDNMGNFAAKDLHSLSDLHGLIDLFEIRTTPAPHSFESTNLQQAIIKVESTIVKNEKKKLAEGLTEVLENNSRRDRIVREIEKFRKSKERSLKKFEKESGAYTREIDEVFKMFTPEDFAAQDRLRELAELYNDRINYYKAHMQSLNKGKNILLRRKALLDRAGTVAVNKVEALKR